MSPALVVGLLANVALLLGVGVLYLFFPATLQRIIHLRDGNSGQLANGADVIVLAHAVPWGTLSLADGSRAAAGPSVTAQPSPSVSPSTSPTAQPTASPAASPAATSAPGTALSPAGTAAGFTYYRLARGTHQLVYTAAPFSTLRCQISVPAATSDTCAVLPTPAVDALRALGAARMVDAQATADHLGADQQKALFDAISGAMSPKATNVQYGERYLNASGQTTFNYQTLQAALVYSVNTDPAHAIALPNAAAPSSPSASPSPSAPPAASPSAPATGTPTGTPGASASTAAPTTCVSLCDVPVDASQSDASQSETVTSPQGTPATSATPEANTPAPWNQLANLVPTWHYTPSRGQTVAAPASMQGGTTSAVVAMTWNGAWQVSASDAAKAKLLGSVVTTAVDALKLPAGWSIASYPADNPADGYLVVAGASPENSAQLLYRFGVLLSVNNLAVSTFPSLPRASSAERTLAAGIKTQ